MLGRLTSPSAERNKGSIARALSRVLPGARSVLEVGSGTGQHVIHFARAMPEITWQPSDCDADFLRSIATWVAEAALPNVRAPLWLDVHDEVWPPIAAEAIVSINMIHIAPYSATLSLMRGAGRILQPGGLLFLYGPFRMGGRHTSASNRAFDAHLRAANASWGVRDLDEVTRDARAAGFDLCRTLKMPANNLSVVLRKSSSPEPRTASGGSQR